MGNRLFCNESGVCPKAQVQRPDVAWEGMG